MQVKKLRKILKELDQDMHVRRLDINIDESTEYDDVHMRQLLAFTGEPIELHVYYGSKLLK